MHTWESNFSNFVIEYLGETETEFQNTLLTFLGGIILFLQQEASVWGFIKEKKLTQDLVLNLKICLKLLHNIETYRILNAKYSFLYICTVGWSDLALFSIFENTFLLIRYIFMSSIPKNWQFWPGTRGSQARQSFNFKRITGSLKINIFIWKLAQTFLIHQRKIYKNKIWKQVFI